MQTHHIKLIDNSYDLESAQQLLNRIIFQKMAFIKDLNFNETGSIEVKIKTLEF
jgi:hypothetical protein